MVSEKKCLFFILELILKKKKKILPTGPLCSLTPLYLASNLVFM